MKLIGLARARDVILGGEELSAEAAYRIGLVSGVIEGDILAAARDRLTLMLERSPAGLRGGEAPAVAGGERRP